MNLLYSRNLKNKKDIEKFLNPDWEKDLYDPFLLLGMKKAVAQIKKARQKKEKVAIFSHFDVDGIVSAVLFRSVLEKIGLNVTVYIPNRLEGYGVTEEGIYQLKKEGVKLIITSDCGISSVKEIQKAKKMGIETIITDHHEIPKVLPKAISIINPHQKKCRYPFKELAGVGVVFKLVQALAKEKNFSLSESNLKWLVDLVGLGTICDVVPLRDENRLFAKYGLIVLNKTRSIGLQKLFRQARLEMGKIDPYAVSFMIGPRINAPGRMDHANVAYYLLTTKNHDDAENLAKDLEKANRERQNLLSRVFEEAKKEIEEKKLFQKKVILIGKKDWPEGIIGLIAGKLKEKYCRPVLALSIGKNHSRGSARSIDKFHITEILELCRDCLTQFGGHKRAAGFSLSNEKIQALKKRLIFLAEERLSEKDLCPKVDIDSKIYISEINWKLWEDLEKFEPTGFGNPQPIFLAEKVEVQSLRLVGKEAKHLKMKLGGLDSIFFDGNNHPIKIKTGDLLDIVFQINVDDWGQERKLQLKIIDMRKMSNN